MKIFVFLSRLQRDAAKWQVRCVWFPFFAAILMVAGCGKSAAPQATTEVNADGLSVTEADTLLAQSSNEMQQPALNIVVNNEAGPLVEISAPVPELPDNMSIQRALKNAGFYQGEVDGKIGPKSKAAIMGFQRKNGLADDGKVGPKTWSLLKVYLNN